MNLKSFEYKPFTASLKKPFRNSSFEIATREGYIIYITGEMGRTSLGEVAPLPGFSRESIADAADELRNAAELAPGFVEAGNSAILKKFFESVQFTPSVCFGIEQAMIGMLLKRDRSLFLESFYNASSIIPVNTVIDLNTEVLGEIEEKMKFGFSTFKIKLGLKNFEDDLAAVKEIRSRFGFEINLRLDVNGKWSPEEAERNLISLEPLKIEYVEEPCGGIDNIIKLAKSSPVPVAVDESLKSITDAERIIKESSVQFIIVKPMIIGAFFGTADLISLANSCGKNVIISSAFETPLGKSLLVFLASLTGHSYAHGLDTAVLLSGGIFEDPYPVVNGAIHFSPDNYPPQFERGRL